MVQAQAQGVKHIAVGYYAATQAGLDPALLTKELLVRLRSTSVPIHLIGTLTFSSWWLLAS